jgi:hypothetical protein
VAKDETRNRGRPVVHGWMRVHSVGLVSICVGDGCESLVELYQQQQIVHMVHAVHANCKCNSRDLNALEDIIAIYINIFIYNKEII